MKHHIEPKLLNHQAPLQILTIIKGNSKKKDVYHPKRNNNHLNLRLFLTNSLN
jgi:hypothetical protein